VKPFVTIFWYWYIKTAKTNFWTRFCISFARNSTLFLFSRYFTHFWTSFYTLFYVVVMIVFLKKYGFRQKTRIFSKHLLKTIAKNAIYHSGGPKKPFEAIKFAPTIRFFFSKKWWKFEKVSFLRKSSPPARTLVALRRPCGWRGTFRTLALTAHAPWLAHQRRAGCCRSRLVKWAPNHPFRPPYLPFTCFWTIALSYC